MNFNVLGFALVVAAGIGFTGLNLCILFLNLKIYTEFFKERVKGK